MGHLVVSNHLLNNLFFLTTYLKYSFIKWVYINFWILSSILLTHMLLLQSQTNYYSSVPCLIIRVSLSFLIFFFRVFLAFGICSFFQLNFNSIFFFWPHLVACGILVPPPGIEPAPSAVKAWSPNHWTAREFNSIFNL